MIDTPGLLDRPLEDRNDIELQAISALRYVGDVLLFILDPSEECGFTMAEQEKLLDEVRHTVKIPVLVVANKIDMPHAEAHADMQMSTLTGRRRRRGQGTPRRDAAAGAAPEAAHRRRGREAGVRAPAVQEKITADRLLTVCNCCPCCCLWKILPSVAPSIGGKVTKMPGLEMVVTDKCTGCGTCAKTCFMNAISVREGRAVINDQCRGCGRCAVKCPRSAIEVHMGDLDETVARITAAVTLLSPDE